MKVTIFELGENEGRRLLIENLFRKFLWPSVTVTKEGYDSGSWRYLKLLQAAIPPEKGISLSVESFSLSSYRVYVKVYFRYAYGWDQWRNPGLTSFFPAVSVQDRMVMVPRGLGSSLAASAGEIPPFYSFKDGGVMEVDFSDEASLSKTVEQVAKAVRADSLQQLQSYARNQDLADTSLSKVAEDLELDLSFVQHLLKGDQRAFERSAYSQMECKITPKTCSPNRWTKAVLSVENKSDIDLTNLMVQIIGPVSVLPERIHLSIPAHSAAEEPIAIKPNEPGDFPVDIRCLLPEDKAFAGVFRQPPFWLKCE